MDGPHVSVLAFVLIGIAVVATSVLVAEFPRISSTAILLFQRYRARIQTSLPTYYFSIFVG